MGTEEIWIDRDTLKDQNTVLKQFARWVIGEACFEGCDLDGGTIQDKAAELGLISAVPYDPDKHRNVEDAEPGDDIYVYSDVVK